MAELNFPYEPLGDEVVLLRPWTAADVPGRLMAFADPTVLRYSWPHTRPYNEDDATRFYEEQEEVRLAAHALNFALAEPSDPKEVLGGASLYSIDLEVGRAAVGYWLAAGARGRGVATHTVSLLAGWAFDSLGIKRLAVECAPDNQASRRVAERCGFILEGILRSHLPFNGSRRDTALYSLLPSDPR